MKRISIDEQLRLAEMAEDLFGLGYWRLDVASGEMVWSRRMYQLFHPEGDSPTYQDLLQRIHPDDRHLSEAGIREALEGRRSRDVVRVIWPSGEIRRLELHRACEHDADGRVRSIYGTVVDVTDRERAVAQLAASEARFRVLTEHSSDIIVRVNRDDIVEYISPSVRRYGYEPDELVGMTGVELLHPDDHGKIAALRRSLFAGEPVDPTADREHRLRARDGAYVWVEGAPSIIFGDDGLPTGFVTLLRDIDARKRFEADLIADRAAAEESAREKSDFLANMSHELRTPLTAVIGFSGLLENETDLSDTARKFARRIGTAASSLLSTINDILDYSKLEANQVELNPRATDVGALARDTIELFGPQAQAKGLSLVLRGADDLPTVDMDPDRVRQVLLNLIGNAVKFTDTGAVTLDLTHELDRLQVRVRDTGSGIPQSQASRLFRRFSQVRRRGRERPSGTGLGLAICKGLVEAMGGRIGVESQEGAGSTFHFWIPAPVAEAETPFVEDLLFDLDILVGKRLLVADDHSTNRELVTAILAPLGVEVVRAEHGEAAVRTAHSVDFDLILMDLRMPGMGGTAAAQAIRTSGANRRTPILAFSADTSEAPSLDFAGAIAKPITPAALLLGVAEALAAHPAGCRESAACS